MYSYVEKGGDGKFYIRPLAAGMNGFPFAEKKSKAEHVSAMLNVAFSRGQEEVRSSIRFLLRAAEDEDCVS